MPQAENDRVQGVKARCSKGKKGGLRVEKKVSRVEKKG